MDKVKVHIVELELSQGSVNGTWNIFDVIDDFGRDEKVLTRDTGFFDCQSKLRLGIVKLGAIKVSIAKLDCCLDCVESCLVDFVKVTGFEECCACAVSDLKK